MCSYRRWELLKISRPPLPTLPEQMVQTPSRPDQNIAYSNCGFQELGPNIEEPKSCLKKVLVILYWSLSCTGAPIYEKPMLRKPWTVDFAPIISFIDTVYLIYYFDYSCYFYEYFLFLALAKNQLEICALPPVNLSASMSAFTDLAGGLDQSPNIDLSLAGYCRLFQIAAILTCHARVFPKVGIPHILKLQILVYVCFQ